MNGIQHRETISKLPDWGTCALKCVIDPMHGY